MCLKFMATCRCADRVAPLALRRYSIRAMLWPAIVPGVRLRVLTYNIRSGTDMLGRPRMTEQAVVMRGTAADVVLLQEVSSREQAERLGSLVKLPYIAFGAARQTSTGEFGTRCCADGRSNMSRITRWRLAGR